jgi:acyl dehydratase
VATITIQELAQRIGEEHVSEWVEVTQDMINRFADATDDHQFIHVNPEMAKMTPFGGTIAHGFLTLSLFTLLIGKTDVPKIEGLKMGLNYGGNKVRFLTPVRSGKRVRGRFKTTGVTERRPGQWEQVIEYTLEIEGEAKPGLVAEWLVLLFV